MPGAELYSLGSVIDGRFASEAGVATGAAAAARDELDTRRVLTVVRLLPEAVAAKLRAAGIAMITAAGAAFGAAAAGAKDVAGGLADRVDEAVENDKLELELDAVDAGLEGTLEVKEVGALNAEQGDVEGDDERVGPDELPQDGALLAGLAGATALDSRGRGPGALAEGRATLEVLAGLEYVGDAEGSFLDKVDDELDAVPDQVEGGEVRVNGSCLLEKGMSGRVGSRARCQFKEETYSNGADNHGRYGKDDRVEDQDVLYDAQDAVVMHEQVQA